MQGRVPEPESRSTTQPPACAAARSSSEAEPSRAEPGRVALAAGALSERGADAAREPALGSGDGGQMGLAGFRAPRAHHARAGAPGLVPSGQAACRASPMRSPAARPAWGRGRRRLASRRLLPRWTTRPISRSVASRWSAWSSECSVVATSNRPSANGMRPPAPTRSSSSGRRSCPRRRSDRPADRDRRTPPPGRSPIQGFPRPAPDVQDALAGEEGELETRGSVNERS